MSYATEVRRRLYAGEPVYGTMAFEFFTPGLIPLLHAAGCEYVVLDLEHSGVGIETIKQQTAYARGLDIAVWVRVPELRYAAVARVLDAGADGVMVPMVETAEQAKDLVRFARYRPEGERSCAFGMAHDHYRAGDPAAVMRGANQRIVLIALIETTRGVENCAAIMATPGLDVGWLGHYDLTNEQGITGRFDHPRFVAAAERLAETCRAAGKAAASLDADLDFLRAQAARGYRLLGFRPGHRGAARRLQPGPRGAPRHRLKDCGRDRRRRSAASYLRLSHHLGERGGEAQQRDGHVDPRPLALAVVDVKAHRRPGSRLEPCQQLVVEQQLDPAALALAALHRHAFLLALIDSEERAGRQGDAERQDEQEPRLVDVGQPPDHGEHHAFAFPVHDPLMHLAYFRRRPLRGSALKRPVLELLAVPRPFRRRGGGALGGLREGCGGAQPGAGRAQRRGREPGSELARHGDS
jgi:2-keto-3-deoxy-L-rhamnonate aldolase RhmA